MATLRDEIKVGDVIRLALPADSVVVAGSAHMRRAVNWVVVLTDWDILPQQVQEGDLVIYPRSLQESMTGQEFVESLQTLAAQEVAGVITFTALAAGIADDVEELGLTVIQVENDAALRDVHKTVAGLLFDRQNQVAERGTQLYRDLSEMSREEQGLPAMADRIARLTGNTVVIQDKRLEILAFSRPADSATMDEVSLRAALMDKDNLPAVLRNRKAAAKSSRSFWQQLLFPNHNVARLISPIISGDRARGYLSIVGEAVSLDLLDKVAVEQGAAACALEMAKAKAVSEAKKQLRGNFLEGILVGSLPKNEIDRLASRLDHDTNQPHAIMAFRWGQNTEFSLRRLETTLNWLLSTNNRPTLVHIYGEDHVCVFQSLRNEEDLSVANRLAQRLREQIEAEYPGIELTGGLSGPAMSLADWPEVHRQAVQALEVGQRLHLQELVNYHSLGVYRLLGKLDNIPAVHEFCDQVIGPLVEYDQQHRSNLVQTIAAYFNHHGNISQTAESLFIHRNTLLYRLDRIQELTGHDMNHADMRLALHLALKLWQLRPDTRIEVS